jgi:hypothetical protein
VKQAFISDCSGFKRSSYYTQGAGESLNGYSLNWRRSRGAVTASSPKLPSVFAKTNPALHIRSDMPYQFA